MTPKRAVPWYCWPLWMLLLAAGLFVFYVLLTPVWVGIRLIEWFAHKRETAAPGKRKRRPVVPRPPLSRAET